MFRLSTATERIAFFLSGYSASFYVTCFSVM